MKCPNCGDIVRAIDNLDTEYYNDSYYDNVIGSCPNCGKTWIWTEVYKFTTVIDVKEINLNDHQ